MVKPRVGLIGFGYWGKNIARVLSEFGVLHAIADIHTGRLLAAGEVYPKEKSGVYCVQSTGEDGARVLKDAGCDHICIATPPETHYSIAMASLNEGLHTFVEKPLSTDGQGAMVLESLALSKSLHLAVGHIYLHNPGLLYIPKPTGEAQLFVKLFNVAGPPSESTRDLFWAGMPHAASIALHFFPVLSDMIETRRADYSISTYLSYFDGSSATLEVADYIGVRKRSVELRVGNTRYVFDADDPATYYTCSGTERRWASSEARVEPLKEEVKAFLNKVKVTPTGSQVVKLVEMMIRDASKAKTNNGVRP